MITWNLWPASGVEAVFWDWALTCKVCASSKQLVSELNWLAGHYVGVGRELTVGVGKHSRRTQEQATDHVYGSWFFILSFLGCQLFQRPTKNTLREKGSMLNFILSEEKFPKRYSFYNLITALGFSYAFHKYKYKHL